MPAASPAATNACSAAEDPPLVISPPALSGIPNHCRNQSITIASIWLGPLAVSHVAAFALKPDARKSAGTPGHVGQVGTKPNDRG